MQSQIEHLLNKLKHLSPEQLTEVTDFIDFLSQRDQDKHLQQCYMQASEKVFSDAWDNDDDSLYDRL